MIVDLDRVEFLDAGGVSALLSRYHLAAEHGVGYRVANPHEMVRRVLDITGLLAVLTRGQD